MISTIRVIMISNILPILRNTETFKKLLESFEENSKIVGNFLEKVNNSIS